MKVVMAKTTVNPILNFSISLLKFRQISGNEQKLLTKFINSVMTKQQQLSKLLLINQNYLETPCVHCQYYWQDRCFNPKFQSAFSTKILNNPSKHCTNHVLRNKNNHTVNFSHHYFLDNKGFYLNQNLKRPQHSWSVWLTVWQ